MCACVLVFSVPYIGVCACKILQFIVRVSVMSI